MKTLFLAILLLSAGCSVPRSDKVTVMPRPETAVSQDLVEQTRYPEIVMAYHIARYADPNQPLLLHESHTVYRVEGQSSWNLHSPPGSFVLPSGTKSLPDPAYASPPVSDAVIAELNQQKMVTRSVTKQAQSLNGSLHEFTAALSSTRNLIEQNRLLREQLVKDEQRLDALEAEMKNKASSREQNEQD